MKKKKAFPTSVNDQITDAVTQANNNKFALQQELINQLKARIASQDNIISQLIAKIPYSNTITWYPTSSPSTYPSPWVSYSSGSSVHIPSDPNQNESSSTPPNNDPKKL